MFQAASAAAEELLVRDTTDVDTRLPRPSLGSAKLDQDVLKGGGQALVLCLQIWSLASFNECTLDQRCDLTASIASIEHKSPVPTTLYCTYSLDCHNRPSPHSRYRSMRSDNDTSGPPGGGSLFSSTPRDSPHTTANRESTAV
eukprot:3882285-Rhodomonas_salina.2